MAANRNALMVAPLYRWGRGAPPLVVPLSRIAARRRGKQPSRPSIPCEALRRPRQCAERPGPPSLAPTTFTAPASQLARSLASHHGVGGLLEGRQRGTRLPLCNGRDD